VVEIQYIGQLVDITKKHYEFEIISIEEGNEIRDSTSSFWNRDSILINELKIITLTIEKNFINQISFNGFTKLKLRKREWFIFEISLEKEQTDYIAFWDENDGNEAIFVENIIFLDRRKSENRWINSFLNFPSEVTNEDINSVIDKIKNKWSKLNSQRHFLAVFNVGQGSCNAICDLEGKPQIYLDFGYGEGVSRENIRLCNCENPLIILSHLHRDHWNLIKNDSRFYNNIWIVPIQENTLKSIQVFKRLWDLGKLICTNLEFRIDTQDQQILNIFNCDIENRDLNHSGKGFTYHISSEHKCLIPGDAKYEVINQPKNRDNINALIFTHHGGRGYKNPPIAPNDHIGVWNFGIRNRYGHPNPKSISEHQKFGWIKQLHTHNGNIAIGHGTTLNHISFNTHECADGHKNIYKNIKSFL
jgi:beta-lactamase superfamily II metal-dependent hydrolase